MTGSPLPDLAPTMAQLTKRDPSALESIHEQVAPALMGIIAAILKDRHEAEDTLQEVFIRIWEKAPKYRSDRGSPMSWLITIARNAALDRYRKRVRQSSAIESAQPELQARASESSPSAASHLFKKEQLHQIHSALSSLPADQREAIELAFFSGLTQIEVAEKLDTPLGTIKARIRRGMQSLKPLLNPCR